MPDVQMKIRQEYFQKGLSFRDIEVQICVVKRQIHQFFEQNRFLFRKGMTADLGRKLSVEQVEVGQFHGGVVGIKSEEFCDVEH